MSNCKIRFLFLFSFSLFVSNIVGQEWNQLSNLPMNARNNPVSFTIGDSAYVGTGYDGTSLYNDFWVYDKQNDQWSQRANFPGARENGIAFSIGNKGYAGFGWDLSPSSSLSSVYEFDPSTNSWSAIASYPGSGGRGIFGTSVNGKGYAGGGGVGRLGSVQRDFWEYNPTTNSWTQKANLPFGRRTGGVAFGFNGYVYLGFGHNSSVDFNDFWRFDPSNNSWTQMASFPGVGRLQPDGFIANGNIIVGGGHRLGVGTPLSDYYEYDPVSDSWSQICGIPAGGRSNHTAFSIADTAYVTLGRLTSGVVNDLWQFVPQPTSVIDTAICQGGTLLLDAFVSGATYLWSDNSTNSTLQVNTIGNYWVEITVNNCTRTDTFKVTQLTNFFIDLGADTALCQGEILTLDATTSGATYEWQDNSTNSTFTLTQAGQYWVEVTTNGCSTRDTINVTYKPLPTVNLGNDTTLCDGETLTLDASNSGATYQWQDNSINATFTVTQADTFYVAVDLNGCEASDSIVVDFQGDLSSVFVDDTLICVDEELTLDATLQVPATYLWSNNSTASTLTVNDSSIYWVEISTQCDTLVDSIRVGLKNCACELEVPNVFTPNGDAVNDYFHPIIKCQLLSYKMNIYNRWGDLVFFSNQPLIQWDGRVKSGKKANEGYYSFIIEYRDALSGQKNTEKGNFMLLH